jgi:hypothetical protein
MGRQNVVVPIFFFKRIWGLGIGAFVGVVYLSTECVHVLKMQFSEYFRIKFNSWDFDRIIGKTLG